MLTFSGRLPAEGADIGWGVGFEKVRVEGVDRFHLVELLPSMVHRQRLPYLAEATRATCMARMLPMCHDRQIHGVVVGFVVIGMGHVLIGAKGAAQFARGDGAVGVVRAVTHD